MNKKNENNILADLRQLYKRKDFFNFRLLYFKSLFYLSNENRKKIAGVIDKMPACEFIQKDNQNLINYAINELNYKLL